mmetsp:Transcript_12369/g.17201  ORF Transcript_12369/g.17201 Transcript_12369/m.17201 type:complete len:180 (+) Transcript_12369:393-932(+)
MLGKEFRYEAASRLVKNHAAICAFAMRGRGRDDSIGPAGSILSSLSSAFSSSPSFLGPSPLEKRLWPAIDLSLRLVACRLLLLEKEPPSRRCDEREGAEGKLEIRKRADAAYSVTACASKYFEGLNDDVVEALAGSLRFLHKRVSIPRDMSIGAGAHFRRALAFVIDQVDAAALYGGNS